MARIINMRRTLHVSLFLLIAGNNSFAGKIVLRIFPSNTLSFRLDKLRTDLIKATLEGFDFKNNQVMLVSQNAVNILSLSYTLNHTLHTPDTLAPCLQKGSAALYPLIFHKKLNYLSANDQLVIVRHDANNQQPYTVTLPKGMNQRILNYLLKDIESDRDCFDFLSSVLDVKKYDINTEEISSEEGLRPGDGIAIFVKQQGNAMNIRHYAIALGDGLYISKLGIGNCISISSMQALLAIYKCKRVALLSFTQTSLHEAAKKGDYKLVKDLLQKRTPIDKEDEIGRTALHWAATGGHLSIVKLLLDAGAKVNHQDMDNSTPLHEASFHGHDAIVKTLVREGAKVNLLDNDKRTALFMATSGENSEVVETLLYGGADPHIENINGWTALHEATCYNRLAIAKLLLLAGANISHKDLSQITPLDIASRYPELKDLKQLLKNYQNACC